ncbi:hypothetical protein Patl1_28121 [Pistacia atlantica]|uniref:Uncharacterized protein n=1 Tax=Pistacia atlantica TaxID=434234 RepID=A0ACC1BGQ3_9ROSI|nr:hypothetical protein Patl1_28121 [Pistacia atlantica]
MRIEGSDSTKGVTPMMAKAPIGHLPSSLPEVIYCALREGDVPLGMPTGDHPFHLRVDQSSTPRRLNLSPLESNRARERLVSPVMEGARKHGEPSAASVPKHISPAVVMLQEFVTPEMFEEDRRMSLLDMLLMLSQVLSRGANILGMFCQESFVVLSNADTIYIKLERVKKSLSTQIYEMLIAG